MTDKKDVKAPNAKRQRVLVARGEMDAKRALAIRLMEGNGVPQNHPKAVALLEDCVACGDAESMLMLAQCCAFGHGMERNTERAESLICEAAEKGNKEAQCLMELSNRWKEKQRIYLGCLFTTLGRGVLDIHSNVYHRGIKGVCTIERVCRLMNIVPCNEINLSRQTQRHIIESTEKKTIIVSHICAECYQQGKALEIQKQHH